EFAAPFPNGFIGHSHTTFTQELFHIAEAETEPEVQPHRVADDFDREPVILMFRGGGRCVHTPTLSCRRGTRQVDNAKRYARTRFAPSPCQERSPPDVARPPSQDTSQGSSLHPPLLVNTEGAGKFRLLAAPSPSGSPLVRHRRTQPPDGVFRLDRT